MNTATDSMLLFSPVGLSEVSVAQAVAHHLLHRKAPVLCFSCCLCVCMTGESLWSVTTQATRMNGMKNKCGVKCPKKVQSQTKILCYRYSGLWISLVLHRHNVVLLKKRKKFQMHKNVQL